MYKEKVEEFDDRVIYKIREIIMKDSPTTYRTIDDVETIELEDDRILNTYLTEQPKLIRFTNGSEIKILEGSSNSPNISMMVFSIDMAKPDSEDTSCISYYCSRCKAIFHADYFTKDEYCSPELYTKCPNCETTFRGWAHNV